MEAYINIALIFIVIVAFSVFVGNKIKKNRESIEEKDINLYDIGLSEEELERRKQKKYELKKALKGCTYGDVNDKKYVKELIFDLLFKEYGVNEVNISKAIPFDIPSLLTAQDKFDILINEYKKSFGYEALNELIKKYNLAELKYVAGSTKPAYVITEEDMHNIYETENLNVSFEDSSVAFFIPTLIMLSVAIINIIPNNIKLFNFFLVIYNNAFLNIFPPIQSPI